MFRVEGGLLADVELVLLLDPAEKECFWVVDTTKAWVFGRLNIESDHGEV